MRQRQIILSNNRGRTKLEQFFNRQNLGKGICDRSVKHICHESGVTGAGMNYYLTNHGFRASMTSLRIYAGHKDNNIILRIVILIQLLWLGRILFVEKRSKAARKPLAVSRRDKYF